MFLGVWLFTGYSLKENRLSSQQLISDSSPTEEWTLCPLPPSILERCLSSACTGLVYAVTTIMSLQMQLPCCVCETVFHCSHSLPLLDSDPRQWRTMILHYTYMHNTYTHAYLCIMYVHMYMCVQIYVYMCTYIFISHVGLSISSLLFSAQNLCLNKSRCQGRSFYYYFAKWTQY